MDGSDSGATGRFVRRVMELAGLEDEDEARLAVASTLDALGELLEPSDARAVEATAGHALVGAASFPAPDDVEVFYERVARRGGLPAGFAREQAQAVCGALAEAMAPADLARMVHRLPPAFAALLRARERSPAGPPPSLTHRPPRQPEHTLAGGRAGSTHPLSEAHPERAQSHSVAREDNPHGETKLASARGLTQERLDEDLAAGRSR